MDTEGGGEVLPIPAAVIDSTLSRLSALHRSLWLASLAGETEVKARTIMREVVELGQYLAMHANAAHKERDATKELPKEPR